jgi:hypothetical protein
MYVLGIRETFCPLRSNFLYKNYIQVYVFSLHNSLISDIFTRSQYVRLIPGIYVFELFIINQSVVVSSDMDQSKVDNEGYVRSKRGHNRNYLRMVDSISVRLVRRSSRPLGGAGSRFFTEVRALRTLKSDGQAQRTCATEFKV